MFFSRALTETEQQCAKVETEALAVTWPYERFEDYLLGLTFLLGTNHKPLSDSASLDELPPIILRFRLKFMMCNCSYTFTWQELIYS